MKADDTRRARALRVLHADVGVRPARSHDPPRPTAHNVPDAAIRSDDAASGIDNAARAQAHHTGASVGSHSPVATQVALSLAQDR
ncbi:hypothetical protein XFF6992_400069 [Xanthomonas citri pv. fuscans]|uniref:Uncharacterized protein n=1 Tax=Xanthomonas campestris pv. phaseoli TaxID=317013 RepID=A0A7Z7IZ06_XANCH|nr:hypothetical protein XFF6992_400069 [Xanthomonas citri pv. fuscans]SOO22823.1 hypothetical protein XFF6991_160014 [Xanthomonas phaseoli pv. phaseoli]SOO35813.1 hypothetical protein XFF6994_5760002 [Xanthomonas citri pv. fuscans]